MLQDRSITIFLAKRVNYCNVNSAVDLMQLHW